MSNQNDTNTQMTTVLDRISAIQKATDLNDAIRQYASLIAEELPAREIRIQKPDQTAAACLLMACRLRKTPIRVTVLAKETSVSKAQILKELQRLSNELEITVPLEDPTTIIQEKCREIELSEAVEAHANRLAELGNDAGVTSGVSPYTFAAAVLYIACSVHDVGLSQADLASHLDVSTATLRERRDDFLGATGGHLFELQFPDAPDDAVSLVNSLLHTAQVAEWASNKRFLGLVAGAWLYAARQYDLDLTVDDLTLQTEVSEATIRARYKQYVDHFDSTETLQTETDRQTSR